MYLADAHVYRLWFASGKVILAADLAALPLNGRFVRAFGCGPHQMFAAPAVRRFQKFTNSWTFAWDTYIISLHRCVSLIIQRNVAHSCKRP